MHRLTVNFKSCCRFKVQVRSYLGNWQVSLLDFFSACDNIYLYTPFTRNHCPNMIPHPKEKPTSVGWQSYPESTEEREDEFIQKRKIAYTITAMILVVCISIISAVVTWLIIRPSPDPPQIPTNRTVTIGNATLVLPVTGLMELTLGIPGKNDTTTVLIGRMLKDNAYTVRGCEDQNSSSCFLIRSGERNYTLLLTYDDYKEEDFSCISVWWTAALDDTLRDCLALGSSRWYGGGLLFHQRWPMKLEKEMTPFKSADIIQVSPSLSVGDWFLSATALTYSS